MVEGDHDFEWDFAGMRGVCEIISGEENLRKNINYVINSDLSWFRIKSDEE
jgi:hypothetical protein